MSYLDYGYLTLLKAMLVDAIKQTFNEDYPVKDFQGIHCSIEYPIDKMAYPGIWVDYTDTGNLMIAGINHREYSDEAADGTRKRYTRWRFSGYAQFTVVALSSLQRDRLYDELVRIMAFGNAPQGGGTDLNIINRFRQIVESNEFIACNFDFDQIEPTGNAAAPGTPWGSDEIIYERSLNMEVIGEFVSDGETLALVDLAKVIFDMQVETPSSVLQADPTGTYTDEFPGYDGHPDGASGDPTAWH